MNTLKNRYYQFVTSVVDHYSCYVLFTSPRNACSKHRRTYKVLKCIGKAWDSKPQSYHYFKIIKLLK